MTPEEAALLRRLTPFSVRLPLITVAWLRQKAAEETGRRGEPVSWQDLMREACEKTYPLPPAYQPEPRYLSGHRGGQAAGDA